MMIKFDLMVAVEKADCFEDNCHWKPACTVRVKDTGEHLANWRKASKLFQTKAPHLMKDFGAGWLAIVARRTHPEGKDR